MTSELKTLKDCFSSLDSKGQGSITKEDLQDPLIGLGFVDTSDEVQKLIDLVDEDGSGEIEFNEFLSILKNNSGGEQSRAIKVFFEGLAQGKFGSTEIPFSNYVLEQRRRSIIDAFRSQDQVKKEKGKRILRNVEV